MNRIEAKELILSELSLPDWKPAKIKTILYQMYEPKNRTYQHDKVIDAACEACGTTREVIFSGSREREPLTANQLIVNYLHSVWNYDYSACAWVLKKKSHATTRNHWYKSLNYINTKDEYFMDKLERFKYNLKKIENL